MAIPSDILTWLAELDDGYLETWANRGLLRRGRKLADSLSPSVCSFDEVCSASIDQHQQRLEAPDFAALSCSCPAVNACHHLVAFVLLLRELGRAHDLSDEPSSSPDWLEPDWISIERTLGLAHVRRARRLLQQAVEVELLDQANGLQAQVNDGALHTVRIPRSSGLKSAICTCGKDRCVHRALAVLVARTKAGLVDPEAEQSEALSHEQQAAINQIEYWLFELIATGTAGLSNAVVSQGDALATVARQVDFPALAGVLGNLVQLLRDEMAAKSFVSAADLRLRLAPLWSRLRALQCRPLPQPLLRLGGEHRRHYKQVTNLQLIGVGAEAWRNPAGARGLTLHLYAPRQRRWYRQADVRPGQSQEDWSPDNAFDKGSWGGISRDKIPGSVLICQQGWCSVDCQLSGREGTRVEIESSTARADSITDYSEAIHHYRDELKLDPVAATPVVPILLSVAKDGKPERDKTNQRWRQSLLDQSGEVITIELIADNPYSKRAIDKLQNLHRKKQRLQQAFGHLVLNDDRLIVLRPISVRCRDQAHWVNLTL